jgi:5-methylcytosine-specific restriction protein A
MSFVPSFSKESIVKNADIVNEFKCGNMGGMRRSKKTNTLVLVSDHTKGLYDDKWFGDILHYTGMGKNGDQEIDFMQNKTLAKSRSNGVDVYLFEVFKPGRYIYKGQVYLCDSPYQEVQKDEDGLLRKVWMFPVRLILD